MRRFTISIVICGICCLLQAQTKELASRFNEQLFLFPQEKIYVHTDKPHYLAGEQIWFRIYLADAITHEPASFSRYVYVELINPTDSAVVRVKIRPEEEAETYYGHLTIPRSTSQGYYTLRTYTAFMLNQAEDYLFTKTLYIGNSQTSESQANTQFGQIPVTDNDFDVSFYPEGGSLLLGAPSKIAFKAMKSNGQSAEVVGVIYNQSGTRIGTFKSNPLGMGLFLLIPQNGDSYYAICEDITGESKRFDLPTALDLGYALSVAQVGDHIHVSVQKSAEASLESLYLLAHTRGMVHLIEPWDHQTNRMAIPKEEFPSGVLHLALFDARLNPVSERLVFIHNQDQALVSYRQDRKEYAPRSLVQNQLTITNPDGRPLNGTFSVSVTSDREVTQDSTTNILTQLLLTSDLRGTIENPAYYFQHTPESTQSLDLLMLTQGWRRYNIAQLAQGRFTCPKLPLELGTKLSGQVTSGLLGRAAEGVEVTVMSVAENFFNTTQTDHEGRFALSIGELPDSTLLAVSVNPAKGVARMELRLDEEVFPKKTLPTLFSSPTDAKQLSQYADKTRQRFSIEADPDAVLLTGVVVTAQRNEPKKSLLYSKPDAYISEDELDTAQGKTILDLLPMKGVQVTRGANGEGFHISIRGGQVSLLNEPIGPINPLLLIDGIPVDVSYLEMINMREVAQIDVLKSASNIAFFGLQGSAGVISIHTKMGGGSSIITSQSPHIKTITPLGYQQPMEFYAPKYETAPRRNNPKPDLRTTIHWQPVVQIDNGMASFEFYTANEEAPYTVVIEGLSNDGEIIRHETKLWKKEQ